MSDAKIEIADAHLGKLREAGLYVSKIFPTGHRWQGGVRVAKPKGVGGNVVPDYVLTCDSLELNAPSIMFIQNGDKWDVFTQECVPQGPNDLNNLWSTLEEAVEDILEFYFGDPERMRKMRGNVVVVER